MTSTTNPYGHTRAAEPGTCTCGRTFTKEAGLTAHVNFHYRKWAKEQAELEALAAKAKEDVPDAKGTRDYREHISFPDGPVWNALYATIGLSPVVDLISVESSRDDGVVTHTLHTKDDPAVWPLAEFELWEFISAVGKGDLLSLKTLTKEYRGTPIGLHILTVLMFLFLDPKESV